MQDPNQPSPQAKDKHATRQIEVINRQKVSNTTSKHEIVNRIESLKTLGNQYSFNIRIKNPEMLSKKDCSIIRMKNPKTH